MKSLPKVSHSPSRVEKRKQPKSRNGCLACKQKRMKCDETKPACLRCLSKKAECPGYGVQPLVWSTRHEKTLLPESNFVDKDNQTLENLISNAQKAITGREELVSPKSTAETIVSESVENGVPSEVDRISPSPAEDEPISPYSPESSPRSEPKRLKSSISIVGERLQKSTVPEFMVHLPTELVHHYFSQVCQIFSSFDGSLNPFRSTISKLFQSSAPIYYAIQSMAAAYLANHFPRMALVGIQMQHEAYKSLHQSQFISTPGSEDLDKVLLSILLIGQTTAWHNPSDLGLRHLNTAKRLNGRRYQVQQTTSNPQVRRQNQFFDQCLLYWEMVASYVADRDDVELTDQPGDGVFEVDVANENRTSIFPHPWTGVSADVQRMFCQVGRLIRRFRKSMTRPTTVDFFVLDMGIDMNSSELVEINLQAKALEENLLSIELPSVSSIVDAGDDNTPAHHYILLAESYKCAALLQIYRIFPFILHQRFQSQI